MSEMVTAKRSGPVSSARASAPPSAVWTSKFMPSVRRMPSSTRGSSSTHRTLPAQPSGLPVPELAPGFAPLRELAPDSYPLEVGLIEGHLARAARALGRDLVRQGVGDVHDGR